MHVCDTSILVGVCSDDLSLLVKRDDVLVAIHIENTAVVVCLGVLYFEGTSSSIRELDRI